MNRRTSSSQQEEGKPSTRPPTRSISRSSNTFHIDPTKEGRPKLPMNDDESQNPMFPESFYEEDDEQSDEQSDDTSSGRGELEYTAHCNVLINSQDYENNTGMQSTQFDYTRVDQSLQNRYINYVTHGKGAGMDTTTYRSDVELLYLLQKSNAPIKMYDQIQKCAIYVT
jgi:hypothetical protein